ncbi:MAG TPA: GMC family oxidoreductase N-terminal domain-containing protein [Candidatus Dormibacteraeota bacterium]|jgi:choline dehydrogenase-like flavoprotein|nr:GMC family oxidoreductase N-terminal domain-containing protein [Candidatus Dormibacteraeota bacterium]
MHRTDMGVLSHSQHRALDALADTLLPSGHAAAPGAHDLGLTERVEAQLATYPRGVRGLVRAMITGFDLMGVASPALRPFSRMSPEQRRRFVEQVESMRLSAPRDLAVGLKGILSLVYFSSPEVSGSIGYDGLPLVPVTQEKVTPRLPVAHWPEVQDGARDECDVVIVGTGAGGAVAAFELAQAGLKVVLVEEGGSYHREDFDGRPLLERVSRAYRDQGLTFTAGNVTISLPLGKAVGGTTVVNSGTCFRAPEWILEKWARGHGVKGSLAADLDPYFAQAEEVLNVTPVPDHLLGKNGEKLRDGARALGWKSGPIPRNIRDCHGSGQCAFGCPRDAKQAMHLSYLPMAAASGARIYSHSRVSRVRHDGVRATGVAVELLDPETGGRRGTLEIHARAVIVAAGAVHTPLLLRESGLAGPSGQLGKNLRIHPGAGALALFDEDLRAWRGTMQSYYIDERLESDGIILEATMPPPGISYSAGALPFWGQQLVEHVADYPRTAAIGLMVSDHCSGRVVRRPGGGALMLYNLGRDEARRLAMAVVMAGEAYFAAGATEFYPIIRGVPVVRSREELRLIEPEKVRPQDLKLSAYHPMGTARMGSDPRTSVVDSDGLAHHCEGLYVCDASLFPTSTAVNPQLTIMATAHRIGRKLAETLAG